MLLLKCKKVCHTNDSRARFGSKRYNFAVKSNCGPFSKESLAQIIATRAFPLLAYSNNLCTP